MNTHNPPPRTDYYRAADSWSEDRVGDLATSRRTAWIVAGAAAALALLLAVALVVLLPLKTTVPYTLLVDRQTGYVTRVDPLDTTTLTADTALTRSFLAQYLIAREGYDIDSLNENYRKVALWSADEARTRYVTSMQATNPASPLAVLPRRAIVDVQLRSLSSLNTDTYLVRYTTVRTDPGGQAQAPQYWAAVVKYRYSGAAMSAADRLVNPLGFQVTRFRRSAETLPEAPPVTATPLGPTSTLPGTALPARAGVARGATTVPGAPVLTRGALPQGGEWVGPGPR